LTFFGEKILVQGEVDSERRRCKKEKSKLSIDGTLHDVSVDLLREENLVHCDCCQRE